jgi:ribosomal-protein-alanine N-acetyltransferase
MLPAEVGVVAGLFAEAAEAAHWSAQELAQLETSGVRIWVAMQNDELAGAVASREAVGEAEILNLAVAPAWRGRGMGRRLMETALEEAISAGVRRVFLEVRESNAGARRFYLRLGFAEAGRRRGYYQHPAEDALLLSRTL